MGVTHMAKLKLFEVGRDEETKRCGCCNWTVSKVYLLAESQEEADKLYQEYGKEDGEPRGLCGDCMCQMLVEIGYEIENELKNQ